MTAKEALLENIRFSQYQSGMTETEEKAFRWLLEQGFDENNIHFSGIRSPDFLTPSGGYEVKKLYKAKTLEDYVIFHKEQYDKLLELNVNVIVFSDDSDEPHLIATMKELEEKVRVYIPPEYDATYIPIAQNLSFPAIIRKEGKVTIPKLVRKSLSLRRGDTVYITEIRKLEPGKTR